MGQSKKLSPTQRDLLKDVVARRCPDLIGIIDLPPLSIPKKDRYRIQEALGNEMLVNPDREIELDELVSYIWSQPLAEEYERGLPEEPLG
jgi:hypothetical protein